MCEIHFDVDETVSNQVQLPESLKVSGLTKSICYGHPTGISRIIYYTWPVLYINI